jgi:dihydrofolate reductase
MSEPARLIYSAIASLDGYVEDEHGDFRWAAPDEELHAFVNELERPVGTYLYGRRMYETMVYWETAGLGADAHAVTRDFGEIWRAAEKIVYSRTLATVQGPRTKLERDFEPSHVNLLKERSDRDITIGGSSLAAQAFAAGIVDECHLLLHPVSVGGGKPALPRGIRTDLTLLDERRFRSGVVHLHYAVHA